MASLRPEIEQRLSSLTPRLRALRVAAGASRLVIAAVGAVAAVALLDAALALPASARGLCFSAWVTCLGVLAWRWVFVPWRTEITPEEVAGELERRLPELGERLRAAVAEGKSDPPSAVRAAVVEDTARRVKAVDLARALPVKPTAQLAGVALAAALAFAAAASYPGGGERLRRVALPWAHSNGRGEFRVHVATGEPTVRRGGPVTLSAYVAHDPGKPTPGKAFLLRRTGPGAPEVRVPMAFDGTTFHLTLPTVAHDFEYCVEAGGARSEWFRVSAIDAVELADGTQVEITPPEYTGRPPRTLTALTELDALQFSTAEFRLKFTRPAAFAQLVWRTEGAAAEVVPLALAADRLSATATLPLRQSGVLTLLLDGAENGKRIRTETLVAVRVTPDAPPQFEQVSGLARRPRTARPTERVRIAFAARDDVAVSGAVLEYAVGASEAKPVVVPVRLQGRGAHASGAIDFPLANKAGEGETVRFRLRVRDNRSLDDPKLGPGEAVYPPSGWSELRLSASAPPLAEQDVIARRDALREGLSAAARDTTAAAPEVEALRRDTAGRDALAFDQAARLNALREKLQAASTALRDLAADASLTPELRPLAANVREVAERSLGPAAEALRKAETDDPAARKAALDTAAARLGEAGAKLAELMTRNDRFAQGRLDQLRLTALAAEQAALADQAKAGGDLLPRQRELLACLGAITAESEPLRAAVEAAKGAEVRRLAEAARRLADSLRQLDAGAKRTASDARAALVAVIARDQNALAKQTTALCGKLETPCRLAGVALPRADDFLRVADLAAAGRTVEALTELEKHARALEHVAAAFDKWAAERADPKPAARQLAAWQDDLRSRSLAAAKAGGFAALPAAAKGAFRDEQRVIEAAVESLALPPEAAVKAARDEAAAHARLAGKALAGGGSGAETAMELAARSLHQLADRTPAVAERLAKSLRALDSLRQELDSSGHAADAVLKGYESRPPDAATAGAVAKKLAPVVERQRKLLAEVESLDLPGLAGRRARVVAALTAAVNDLSDGSSLDVLASQAWARREFERLKWAIEGTPPPDATAGELHRGVAELADALDARGPNLPAMALEPVAPILQDASRRLAAVAAPEAAVLLNEARVAVQAAEDGLRQRPEEARRRIRAAAGSLGRLADRLNGSEPDLARVQRLARLRRAASEKPKELLFSDEALRQLGREADELAATRAGPAGQPLKKRALELYAKLRAKSDPDRFGTDLKALATALDELAAKMADVAELATTPAPAAPPEPLAADGFLPSKPLADAIRVLAQRQRALHAQVTSLAAELAGRLRPSPWTPEGRVVLRQVARASELVRRADEFIQQLEAAARERAADDPAAEVLTGTANGAKEARRRLAASLGKAVEGNTAEAERLRASAEAALREAGEELASAAPPGTAPAVGESLRAAERAMRKAIQHLAPGGDPAPAERAMRDAADTLRNAEFGMRN